MKNETPTSRLKSLAGMLPIVAIVAIGFYSHKHYGTDGIVGVLFGIYLILYAVIAVRRWKPEEISPIRRISYRSRRVLILAGLAGIVGGALDMCGSPILKPRFRISEAEVTKISAKISNRPDKEPTIGEFEVPDSYHDKVLDFLDGASPHRSQIDWAILGQLEITTNSGVLYVVLFSAGDKLVFDARPRGRYESDSLMDFIRTIEAAKKAQAEE